MLRTVKGGCGLQKSGCGLHFCTCCARNDAKFPPNCQHLPAPMCISPYLKLYSLIFGGTTEFEVNHHCPHGFLDFSKLVQISDAIH